jgi:hypothetical protein
VKRTVLFIVVLFMAFVTFIFICWWNLIGVHRYEGRRDTIGPPFDNGAKVLGYLEAYKEKYGKYPDSLEALVPEFTDQIPLPEWGTNRWKYFTEGDSGEEFSLVAKRAEDDIWGHVYLSSWKSWRYDNSQ